MKIFHICCCVLQNSHLNGLKLQKNPVKWPTFTRKLRRTFSLTFSYQLTWRWCHHKKENRTEFFSFLNFSFVTQAKANLNWSDTSWLNLQPKGFASKARPRSPSLVSKVHILQQRLYYTRRTRHGPCGFWLKLTGLFLQEACLLWSTSTPFLLTPYLADWCSTLKVRSPTFGRIPLKSSGDAENWQFFSPHRSEDTRREPWKCSIWRPNQNWWVQILRISLTQGRLSA